MKNVVLIFFAILTNFAKAGTDYNVQLIAKELRSRAAVTIRNESVYIEMRAVNDVTHKVKKAITVYNKSGDYYAYIPLYYNKSSVIKSVKGMIYNEFGLPIAKIGMKDFTDVSAADGFSMFSDTRVKYYGYNAIQYPYTIEFEYEIQHKQNLAIPHWNPNFSPQVSVEHSDYTFAAPKGTAIRVLSQHLDTEPKVATTEKMETRTWEVNNVAAVKEENFTPSFRKRSIRLDIVPKNISYYGRTGSFETWEDFGKWKYDNLLAGKQNLDEKIKNKVIELTKNCSTAKEKAKVLYHYMQEKTRYISIQIGIGGLEPFPASDVEKYGYGDCKALVNYMQNLLTFADIPSYYCIVEAGSQKESLKLDFANMQDGNHIILCIPFENDTTWLECTSQEMPFGFLGDFTDDRLVLACTPNGGVVMKTPSYSENENRQIRLAKLKLVDYAGLEGTIETNFFGTQYDNHMDVCRANNTEKPKLLARHYDINNISFSNIAYNKLELDSPYLQEKFAVNINNIATKSGNRLMLPSSLFNSYSNIQRNEDRQQQIYINRGFTDEDIIEIELPEGINKNMQPMRKVLTCEMGTYAFTASIEENMLRCKRTLTIKQGNYPPSLYNEFHEFLKTVSQTDKGRFTLELLP